jgi:hypothetical protein
LAPPTRRDHRSAAGEDAVNDEIALYALRFLEATEPGENPVTNETRQAATVVANMRLREAIQATLVAERAEQIAQGKS